MVLSKVPLLHNSMSIDWEIVQVVGYCRGWEGLQSDVRIARKCWLFMEYGNFVLLLGMELLPLWWIRMFGSKLWDFSMALRDKIAAVAGRRWVWTREGAPHSVWSDSISIKSWRFWRLLRVENGITIGGSSFCALFLDHWIDGRPRAAISSW